jgi:hypothetical protein
VKNKAILDEITIKTVATTEPLSVGDDFDYVGVPYKVVARISRAFWWADVERRRQEDKQDGTLPKRAGIYYTDSKEFKPTRRKPGPEFMYCYVLKEK